MTAQIHHFRPHTKLQGIATAHTHRILVGEIYLLSMLRIPGLPANDDDGRQPVVELRRRKGWPTRDAAMDPEYEIDKALIERRDEWPRLLGATVWEEDNGDQDIDGKYLMPKNPAENPVDRATGKRITCSALFCKLAPCTQGELPFVANDVLKLGLDLSALEEDGSVTVPQQQATANGEDSGATTKVVDPAATKAGETRNNDRDERKTKGKKGRRPKTRATKFTGWRGQLLLDRDGEVRKILANAITAFREAPELRGLLWFDAFHLRATIRGRAPWMSEPVNEVWTETHDMLATDWLQHQEVFVRLEIVRQAVDTVAQEQRFHPVIEYLERCEWDGEKRLDTWAIKYLGVVENEDNSAYIRAVSSRWMMSAVARIVEPGCKADCCLILEGPQGILKSTALKTLAAPWFTDEIATLGSKDAALQLLGAWVIELSELDAMARSEISRTKAFMSRSTDRYRPPYGHRVVEVPRQSIFAGTVNRSQYLGDETGGRRFWPLACGEIDVNGLSEVRDQLWAEARFRYAEGEHWWLDAPKIVARAEIEQEDRFEEDPWEAEIAAYLMIHLSTATVDGIAMADILKSCVYLTTDKQEPKHSIRVGRCLRRLGWKRRQKGTGEERGTWRYWPPKDRGES